MLGEHTIQLSKLANYSCLSCYYRFGYVQAQKITHYYYCYLLILLFCVSGDVVRQRGSVEKEYTLQTTKNEEMFVTCKLDWTPSGQA